MSAGAGSPPRERKVGVDALAALSRAHRRAQPVRVRRGPPSRRAQATRCSTTPSARASARCTRRSRRSPPGAPAPRSSRATSPRCSRPRSPDKPSDWAPLVYCWRGGKRSGALAHILNEIGWRAVQLDGGYRTYRRHVVAQLAVLPATLPLRGHLRAHRIGQEPAARRARRRRRAGARPRGAGAAPRLDAGRPARRPAAVAEVVREPAAGGARSASIRRGPVYVESESRNIGTVQLPDALLDAMRAASCVVLDTPDALRVALLKEEYAHFLADPALLAPGSRACSSCTAGRRSTTGSAAAAAGDWDTLVRRAPRPALRSDVHAVDREELSRRRRRPRPLARGHHRRRFRALARELECRTGQVRFPGNGSNRVRSNFRGTRASRCGGIGPDPICPPKLDLTPFPTRRTTLNMRDYAFRIVNVFAETPLAGNPLCVFEDARGLDDATMQALALQFNLSETTFVLPSTAATARVRIFTPTFEMPFAGHPTLGTAHVVRALAGCGRRGAPGDAGRCHPGVRARRRLDAAGERAEAPRRRRDARRARRDARARRGRRRFARAAAPPLWVDTGAEQLVIPLASADAVRRAAPRADLLLAFGRDGARAMAYVWAFDPARAAVAAAATSGASRASSFPSTARWSRTRAPDRPAPISADGCSRPAPRCRNGWRSRRATPSAGPAGSVSRSPPTAASACPAA